MLPQSRKPPSPAIPPPSAVPRLLVSRRGLSSAQLEAKARLDHSGDFSATVSKVPVLSLFLEPRLAAANAAKYMTPTANTAPESLPLTCGQPRDRSHFAVKFCHSPNTRRADVRCPRSPRDTKYPARDHKFCARSRTWRWIKVAYNSGASRMRARIYSADK